MVVPEEWSSNCIRIFSLPSINIHSLPSQLTLFLKHSRKLVKSRWQEWAHSSHSSCLSLLPAQTPDNRDSALWSPTSREAWFAHYYLIHYLTHKHLYTLQSQKYKTFPLNPALFRDMFTAFLQNHLTWLHTFPIYLTRKNGHMCMWRGFCLANSGDVESIHGYNRLYFLSQKPLHSNCSEDRDVSWPLIRISVIALLHSLFKLADT